ncbi:hypothetical protein NGRA_1267 [Nosema granulosis]|uniref:Uncharacterized protein n=1 Tax=Nosema granulosis TaxID=83296 RepID=A0A9P6KZJ0_9MICR|nr:hypothetical protein NGRA_1267 [Nosema granulosis]
MVVRTQMKTNNKIRETICRSLINYTKSFILLRIQLLPERFFLSTALVLLLNLSSALFVLGIHWNLVLYLFLILAFCLINCLLLSLSEGNDVSRLPIAETKNEVDAVHKIQPGVRINEMKQCINETGATPENTKISILVPILYFYISLLSLTYLPFYILFSYKSSFWKPVILIIFMGLYNIFFLNNCNRSAVSQILNTISVFVFVYLCIDRIKLGD